jgi:hypothetical protein
VHGVHAAAPAVEKVPALHCVGAVVLIAGHSDPCGQVWGLAVALVGQTVPGGHAMHADALVAVGSPW